MEPSDGGFPAPSVSQLVCRCEWCGHENMRPRGVEIAVQTEPTITLEEETQTVKMGAELSFADLEFLERPSDVEMEDEKPVIDDEKSEKPSHNEEMLEIGGSEEEKPIVEELVSKTPEINLPLVSELSSSPKKGKANASFSGKDSQKKASLIQDNKNVVQEKKNVRQEKEIVRQEKKNVLPSSKRIRSHPECATIKAKQGDEIKCSSSSYVNPEGKHRDTYRIDMLVPKRESDDGRIQGVPRREANDGRVHKCEECGARFAYPSTLVYHKKIHTGVSKYGIVVYDNSGSLNQARFARIGALFMVFTTPVCLIAGYVDTILINPNEEDPSMKEMMRWSIITLTLTTLAVKFSQNTCRKTLTTLYFNKAEGKIYLDAFRGWFCKPKMYGPYSPSIAYRTLETRREGNGFRTYNKLIFEPHIMSARILSQEEVVEHKIINRNIEVEGSDMGNKSFEIREELIANYTLWRKLFKIKEDENKDKKEEKDVKAKRKIYD
eukprot:sb/3464152/